MKNDDFLAVGRVLRSHGGSGEIRVKTVPGLAWENIRSIVLRRGARVEEFPVDALRPHQGCYLLKLAGVDDRAAAEALTGGELLLRREALGRTEEGVFLTGQLIGCRVLTADGRELGKVTDVMAVGDSGLLVVAHEGREVLIPLARAICPEIDPEAGRILVDPPEGLLDLNEI